MKHSKRCWVVAAKQYENCDDLTVYSQPIDCRNHENFYYDCSDCKDITRPTKREALQTIRAIKKVLNGTGRES